MQLSFVEGRNRMKLCNKISKGVAKGAEVICMLTIAALVLVIVVELLRRNFLGQSFGGNVQLCGILFLWMAFIGLIPLYRDSGLMRLDFLVARTKGPVYEVLYFANKLFSLLLGLVMEPGAILTLMLPVLLPIANGLGLDLVHFGVMVVLNLMIGQVTPPFGVCLFVISDVNKLKLERLYRSILPFLVPLILTLILVTYVPGIVTALPNALLS